MFSAPKKTFHSSDSFRQMLETNFQKRHLVHLSSGRTVPLHNSCLWIVVRGMVRLGALTEQGDELMLGLAGPNESFGEPLSNVPAFEATTLSDCDLLCIPFQEIHDSPGLAKDLLSTVMLRQRQATNLLALVGLRRIEERVRGFLELLAVDYGQPCELGLRLPVRLTHQDMANALSTTRVTVTRIIGQLKDEGWLLLDQQRHLVMTHPKQSVHRKH